MICSHKMYNCEENLSEKLVTLKELRHMLESYAMTEGDLGSMVRNQNKNYDKSEQSFGKKD